MAWLAVCRAYQGITYIILGATWQSKHIPISSDMQNVRLTVCFARNGSSPGEMGIHPGVATHCLVAGQPGGSRNSPSPGQGASHQRWARLECWLEGGPISVGSAARHIAVEQRELKLRRKPRQKPHLKVHPLD